jgi:hypothetical protein
MAWTRPGWLSEQPGHTASGVELWCYSDRFSYAPGDQIDLRVHTNAPNYSIRVLRDGSNPREVFTRTDIPGLAYETPKDSYAAGCGWPVALSFKVGDDWASGLYLVIIATEAPDGRTFEREHFFVVRRSAEHGLAPFAFVLTTSTLIAYNDWGGANHYRGLRDDPFDDPPSPRLSTQRPIARGFLRKPIGAPRQPVTVIAQPGWQPTYDTYAWARLHDYSRHHAACFWATYERHFAVWAEQHGYELDYLTQHDLHADIDALHGYRCAVVVGHDEYWTWEMRDAVDHFVDEGGALARFAGNFLWQVRLEDDATTQVCYKAPQKDPVARSNPSRATTMWDATSVGRPGATTMGLTGSMGIYAHYGATSPRSSGGFTVYRPDHWAFADTDLYFGDVLGATPTSLAAFEMDGVDFTFRKGLPYPTFEDSAPSTLEILAMAPAVIGEADRWNGQIALAGPDYEFADFLESLGENAPEFLQDRRYGAGMIGAFTREHGEVFNAGTCEWVNGLIRRDWFTERITQNVLNRFAARPAVALR